MTAYEEAVTVEKFSSIASLIFYAFIGVAVAMILFVNMTNQILAFIDSTVLADYDKFVGMANLYHEDADYMDEVLQNFYASAENLRTTVAVMADGIDGINIAVNESAQGVAMAAQNTGALVEALESIKGEADINLEISESLQGEVNRFKNI